MASPPPASPPTPQDQRVAAQPAPKRRLPPFLDHFNGRDLKVLFRCWVGAWVGALLMFINPTLKTLGQAAFFACFIQLILPPQGIVFIHLLGVVTICLGMFVAWGWGVIVMKASLAARPAAETQARLQMLQQTAATQANATGIAPALVGQRLVYEGFMLDVRITVVAYCLLCLFIYVLARLRANNAKLALTQVFGTIIIDIFLCYSPVLPSFNGTLPLVIIKPAVIGIGLSFVSSILFFPRSTSHVVLDGIEGMLGLLKLPLELTSAAMAKDADRMDLQQLRKTRAGIIAAIRQVEPALAFLPLDFSVGYWDARDIESFKEPVRHVVTATLSLLDFQIGRVYGEIRDESVLEQYDGQPKQQQEQQQQEEQKEQRKEQEEENKRALHQVGHHQLSQLAEMLDGLRFPDHHPVRDEVTAQLSQASREAIACSLEGLALVRECIHMVNSRRWFGRPSETERDELFRRSQVVLESLRTARGTFINQTTDALLSEYTPLLESLHTREDQWETVHELRGLVLGMVFQEHLSTVIDKTEALLTRISTVFHKSTRIRVWWPSSVRYAVSWASGKKGDAPVVMAQATDTDPDKTEEITRAAQEKLRMSRQYRTKQRSGLGRAVLGVYHWLTSNEGLYGLRVVVVTIALSIPGLLPNTAGFYYREKGLWALIMGQTSLLVYMADFTFSTICRVLGTVIGGVLGLVGWYIGSGHGPGNPYGMGAVMAVLVAIFLWVRLWAPPSLLQASIMASATALLTIGYSYSDTHIPQYGNPGEGYSVFWRRLVLVLIGVSASLIVQLFPSPPSAARHISKTLSNSIRAVSDHYALLLSCWNHPGDKGQILAEPITLQLAQSLSALDGPIQLLRFEFSSSRFDSTTLERVKDLCMTLNRELGRLLVLSSSLPLDFQTRLTQQMGLLDHRVIGQVMAVLGVCEQALKTGDAPPEILPTPLVRRALEYRQHAVHIAFTAELVRDEHYRRFCVALSSYLRFLGAVDELTLVIKGALGEAHLVSKDLLDLV